MRLRHRPLTQAVVVSWDIIGGNISGKPFGDMPQSRLVLDVELPDGGRARCATYQFISFPELALMQPGARLSVRYKVKKRRVVAKIDRAIAFASLWAGAPLGAGRYGPPDGLIDDNGDPIKPFADPNSTLTIGTLVTTWTVLDGDSPAWTHTRFTFDVALPHGGTVRADVSYALVSELDAWHLRPDQVALMLPGTRYPLSYNAHGKRGHQIRIVPLDPAEVEALARRLDVQHSTL
jgi:hypothetical protein